MWTLIIMTLVIIAFLFVQTSSARKRQAKQAQMIDDRLRPGAWVMTTAGFYGQFVERDGEVVILQTVDGTETFWSQRAVAQVVDEPPFAPAADVEADDDLASGTKIVDVEGADAASEQPGGQAPGNHGDDGAAAAAKDKQD